VVFPLTFPSSPRLVTEELCVHLPLLSLLDLVLMLFHLQDYVYSLLTGYVDPPPGVEIREGLNYNPYFPGGAISMGRVLYDGLVEFDDGTPATTSQMAKDVTTFLAWASEPELDQRKKMGMQATIILSGLLAISIWVKKFKWAPIKSRKLVCMSTSTCPTPFLPYSYSLPRADNPPSIKH
jgi:hypothetical protein